jgi:6-phosphogluconolactonase (cycloisomerase 2 family)
VKFAYVGCRTTKERNARGKGLKVYSIEEKSGEWNEIQLLEVKNPSYLAFDRDKKYLYTVHGDDTTVSAYGIDDIGKLSHINTVSSGGKNPVFISIDETNRYCIVSTLQGGTVSTLPRNPDGGLGDPIHWARIPGKDEGKISHPHQCLFDHSMRYVCVPTQGRIQGYGEVNLFRLEPDGQLTLTQRLRAREYDEPRHVAFHPNNRYAYVVNEKGNSVTFYLFHEGEGNLEPRQILPSLPETYTGEGQASAILVHPEGKFLYVSNRIHESVAVYVINVNTGYLHNVGFEPCLGKTPRFMTFDEAGTQLFVANEDSDTIRVFDVDSKTGKLIFSERTIMTESPVCIVFK